jgi:hypothetical protein
MARSLILKGGDLAHSLCKFTPHESLVIVVLAYVSSAAETNAVVLTKTNSSCETNFKRCNGLFLNAVGANNSGSKTSAFPGCAHRNVCSDVETGSTFRRLAKGMHGKLQTTFSPNSLWSKRRLTSTTRGARCRNWSCRFERTRLISLRLTSSTRRTFVTVENGQGLSKIGRSDS